MLNPVMFAAYASDMLETDHKLVVFTSVTDASFGGNTALDDLSFVPVSADISLTTVSPSFLPVEGVGANFYACKLHTCDNGFAIAPLPLSVFFAAEKGLAGAFKRFYPARYSFTAPGLEPRTWAIMTGVFAMIGFAVRWRVNKVAAAESQSRLGQHQRQPYEPPLSQAYRLHHFGQFDPATSAVDSGELAPDRRYADDPISSYVDLVEPVSSGKSVANFDASIGSRTWEEPLARYRVFTLIDGMVDSCQSFDAPNDRDALLQVRSRRPNQSFELWRGNVLVSRQSPLNGPPGLF